MFCLRFVLCSANVPPIFSLLFQQCSVYIPFMLCLSSGWYLGLISQTPNTISPKLNSSSPTPKYHLLLLSEPGKARADQRLDRRQLPNWTSLSLLWSFRIGILRFVAFRTTKARTDHGRPTVGQNATSQLQIFVFTLHSILSGYESSNFSLSKNSHWSQKTNCPTEGNFPIGHLGIQFVWCSFRIWIFRFLTWVK